MTNSKTTRKALLSSVLALTMCVAMLIATTFAWFTDTASTSVNKIQAGTLDVDIVDATNETQSLANGTLNWVQAKSDNNGGITTEQVNGENILWEPGCTYQLQPFKVVNKGNLAIKYAIKITGINGDAKLNKAIEWTMKIGSENLNIEDGEYTLLNGNNESEGIVIKGHMKEEAGNEYQGLSIDNIAITVYATQLASEFDSTTDQYDAGAFDALKTLYPVSASAEVTETGASIATETVTMTVPKEAIEEGVDNVSMTVTKSADVDSSFTLTSGEGMTLQQFDVKVTGIKSDNSSEIEVEMFIGKGYSFTGEYDLTVQHKKSETDVETITGATYDSNTGFVTFKTTSFSPFAVATPNVDAVVGTGTDTTYYADLGSAISETGEIKLLRNVTISSLNVPRTLTIDLNNYTLKYNNNESIEVSTKGTVFTLKNGTFDSKNVTKSAGAVIVNKENTTTTLDSVKATANQTLLYPEGNASAINVLNGSEIIAGGYGIATNAGDEGKTGIRINIENSKVTTTSTKGDNCAVLMNVGGTVKIKSSKITGDRQGVFLRTGTATIEDSTIKSTGKFGNDGNYLTEWWGSGNEAPMGALVVGTYTENKKSYPGDATCTLTNTTVDGGSCGRDVLMAASAGRTASATSDGNPKIGTVYSMTDDDTNTSSTVYGPTCDTLISA